MNALFEAAKRGDVVGLKKALKDPDIDPNYQITKTGFTALHTSIAWGNYHCTRLLILNPDANLTIRDKNGRNFRILARELNENSRWLGVSTLNLKATQKNRTLKS